MNMRQRGKGSQIFAGYGVDSDFKNLVSTCPVFEEAVTQLARFVDLCPLSKQVGQRYKCS